MYLERFLMTGALIVLQLIGVLFLVMYSLNHNIPESSQELIAFTEDEVINYLIEEKGYDKKRSFIGEV